jgi:predicted small metal-binding protein
MTKVKVVYCHDLGFDCEGVVRSESEEELLSKVVAHARDVHDLNEISDEMVKKVKAVIVIEE